MATKTRAMTAAQLIKKRQRLGLTQQALAAQLGVTRNTVVRWEMGLHPIPEIAVRMLAHLEPR